MKYADRIKKFERESQKKKRKQPKRELKNKKVGQVETPKLPDQGEVDEYLNKYTDEDKIGEVEARMRAKKRKSEKPAKKEIKTKNKMFADCNF